MAKNEIQIGDVIVGNNKRVFLIAEIGINHNGSLSTAKKLIDGAFACNWDCVKFQKRTPDICVPSSQKNIIRDTPWGKIKYIDYRYKIEFGKKEYEYIDKYTREKPILWSASAWDKPSIKFLLEFDVPFIKIPSAKLAENDMIEEAARCGKPVFLSTGMSTVEEIDIAVDILDNYSSGNYILMHTNSTYPAPSDELNLKVINFLRDRYNCIVGYSGHEYDLEPSVLSVILGAKVVERHVTLDHNMWGSDQHASLEIHAMDMLQKRIREAEIVLGDGVKRLTENEKKVRKKLRGY